MRKYEAMFIVKPDLSEEDKKILFQQIQEAVLKNKGSVSQGAIWAEKRKMLFKIKKYWEGVYYLLNFSVEPAALSEIKRNYQLNENILRVLITNID